MMVWMAYWDFWLDVFVACYGADPEQADHGDNVIPIKRKLR